MRLQVEAAVSGEEEMISGLRKRARGCEELVEIFLSEPFAAKRI
jgi:hypothetical protein